MVIIWCIMCADNIFVQYFIDEYYKSEIMVTG